MIDSTQSVLRAHAKVLFFVFLLALAVRLVFAVYFEWAGTDSAKYQTIALNLLAGNGFSWETAPPYEPNLYRTPVYPVFLAGIYAVFGHNNFVVYVAQAAIGAVTCVVAYAIARRYWDHRTALVAAVFLAVFTFAAYLGANTATETLFTFLVGCAILALVRAFEEPSPRSMAWAGALIGFSMLCRPEALLFPLFVAATFVVTRRFDMRGWQLAGIYVACACLVITPWIIRNYGVTGKFIPLVNRGAAWGFWTSANPCYDHNAYEFIPGCDDNPLIEAEATSGEIEKGKLESQMWRAGVEIVLADPAAYLKRRAYDYAHLWIVTGDYLLLQYNRPYWEARATRAYGLIAAKLGLLFVVGMLPLFLAVCGALFERKRLVALAPIWLYVVYVAVTRMPFDLEPRHLLPAWPFVLMFGAVGAVGLWRRFVQRESVA